MMTGTEGTPESVEDNLLKRRFEMATPLGIAFLDYRLEGQTLYLIHAEVPRAARGQGIGGRLTSSVLESARARGLKVVPMCGYVAAFMAGNPQYADLRA
ncbi:MAG: GNAT family N-acetyltransferase [Acidobacteriota bacterium]